MRVPIAFGLSYPERIESGASPLEFETLGSLTFAPADHARFPSLRLAIEALRGAPGATAVLNAANEQAVVAFLAGTIRFDQIHRVNAATVEAISPDAGAVRSLEGLLDLDARSRAQAAYFVKGLSA
jgi:1-deoxy-D-xylulose-5-phosphate reductoisomerase